MLKVDFDLAPPLSGQHENHIKDETYFCKSSDGRERRALDAARTRASGHGGTALPADGSDGCLRLVGDGRARRVDGDDDDRRHPHLLSTR